MRHATALLLLAVTAPAAAQPVVERWGTLREVLRDGRTEARVNVAELERPAVFGLGALAELEGELVVVDGEAWVSRPGAAGGITTGRAEPTDRATFAVASVVEDWTEHRLPRDLSLPELEGEVVRLAREQGLDAEATFPFVVTGRFRDLEAHVLAGACAFASAEPLPEAERPREIRRARARGVVVGFVSGDPPGVISHHGSRTHAHVLLSGRDRQAGHLDGAVLSRGARLRLPASRMSGAAPPRGHGS